MIVANPNAVRAIAEAKFKTDKIDARMLACGALDGYRNFMYAAKKFEAVKLTDEELVMVSLDAGGWLVRRCYGSTRRARFPSSLRSQEPNAQSLIRARRHF